MNKKMVLISSDEMDLMNTEFCKGVAYLMDIDPKNFMKLVIESRFNHNRFHVTEEENDILNHCVNADDMYCSSLINLSRPISEEIEKAAFMVIMNLDNDMIECLNNIETLSFTQKVDAYYAAHLKEIESSTSYMRHLKELYYEYCLIINATMAVTKKKES